VSVVNVFHTRSCTCTVANGVLVLLVPKLFYFFFVFFIVFCEFLCMFNICYMRPETYEWAFKEAGFSHFEWFPLDLFESDSKEDREWYLDVMHTPLSQDSELGSVIFFSIMKKRK
jgi:hypothetical protein